MLIDATHAEETRVVVVDGNKVEEFDFEAQARKQLSGNIYLAKVMRVEPSLQAAFVDYGGNRHGFLAFNEVHPDYYQIPVADREALLAEEAAYAEQDDDDNGEDEKPRRKRSRSRSKSSAEKTGTSDAVTTSGDDIAGMETIDLTEPAPDATAEDVQASETVAETAEASVQTGSDATADAPVDAPESGAEAPDAGMSIEAVPEAGFDAGPGTGVAGSGPLAPEAEASDAGAQTATPEGEAGEQPATLEAAPEKTDEEDDAPATEAEDEKASDDSIEQVSAEEEAEDIRPRRKPRPKRYKIQEVVKVRQIMLVQVVKEERGNKGAALTTYLSLAGRYCVLMPNTARGGGISRKITNAADRKKLKEIASSLEVPKGAGLIVRTAGSERTKSEIKRDYEYLQRLWEQVRELTLKSVAPAPIYEEGNLIKRSIRDLYSREIDEVVVEGEAGYRVAKDFMKMIMPSHAKNVKHYTEQMPLYARYQVESTLGAMFNPVVQLPSGGYIVIDVTEALVAVDVNSGRATKEGSIEQTALKTNLEAAEEVARQMRLRDLAGLIVIDFIDMDERRNNTAVEKRLKDKLKTDRARIQVGRISGFGLLEMSRQRLRPGMLEASTQPCPHCHGTGLLRSDDSVALSILRALEEEGVRGRSGEVLVKAPVVLANYLMNHKREHIAQIEARYGLSIRVEAVVDMVSPDFALEKFKTATRVVPERPSAVISSDMAAMDEAEVVEEPEVDEEDDQDQEASSPSHEEGDDKPRKKRRRRRRRRKSNDGDDENGQNGSDEQAAEGEASAEASENGASEEDEDAPKPKRRRTRSRGGKSAVSDAGADAVAAEDASDVAADAETESAETPKPKRRRRSRKSDAAPTGDGDAASADSADGSEAESTETAEEAPAAPKRRRSRRKPAAETAGDAPKEDAPQGAAPLASDLIPSHAEGAQDASEPSVDAADLSAERVPEGAMDAGGDAQQAETTPEAAGQPVAEPSPAPAAEQEVEATPEETAPEADQPSSDAEPEPAAEAEPTPEPEPEEPAKPKRRGWWSL